MEGEFARLHRHEPVEIGQLGKAVQRICDRAVPSVLGLIALGEPSRAVTIEVPHPFGVLHGFKVTREPDRIRNGGLLPVALVYQYFDLGNETL